MPPVEKVRPGLWSIPVPIPDNPLRYVLVYAFELDNGIAIVDAGWNTEDAWSALNNGLAEAGGSIADVRAVLVTHIHPDHYGLAGRVREESGAGSACTPPTPRCSRPATSRPTTSWPGSASSSRTPGCRPPSSPTSTSPR